MTLTRVVSMVKWGLGIWLKKLWGNTGDKDAEAVTINNLIEKKTEVEVVDGEK